MSGRLPATSDCLGVNGRMPKLDFRCPNRAANEMNSTPFLLHPFRALERLEWLEWLEWLEHDVPSNIDTIIDNLILNDNIFRAHGGPKRKTIHQSRISPGKNWMDRSTSADRPWEHPGRICISLQAQRQALIINKWRLKNRS